jgi:AcrR family transcriptional regulator
VADRLSRSDVVDNRARILGAARAVFTAEGLTAPVHAVARRAGVGPATLYRHFPTKRDLVTAAFADRLHACETIVDQGLADPDPWRGLRTVLTEICVLHAQDHAFTSTVLAAYPDAVDAAVGRRHALTGVTELTRRAKSTGRLRPDVVVDDLILMIMANNGIQAASPAARVAASRRFATLAIEALRAGPATS